MSTGIHAIAGCDRCFFFSCFRQTDKLLIGPLKARSRILITKTQMGSVLTLSLLWAPCSIHVGNLDDLTRVQNYLQWIIHLAATHG